MDLKINNWISDLCIIEENVIEMLESRELFSKIWEIVNSNSSLKYNAVLPNWICWNYLDKMVLEIRKQIDTDHRVVSLKKILKEIIVDHKLISRERFLELYKNSCSLYSRLQNKFNRQFTSLAGAGDYLDEKIIADDIGALAEKWKPIDNLANKVVAHQNRKALSTSLNMTFGRYIWRLILLLNWLINIPNS